jgi:hypothetical protein
MSEATLGGDQINQVPEDQAEAVVEKKRISIFNLPPGIMTRDDLRDLCKPYGSVVEVEYIGARGQKPAFGFVTFRTGADAEFAVYRLNLANLGSKGPLKAGFPADRPKRDPNVQKKKVKKQPQPLSLLTPKNPNANVQNQNTLQQTPPLSPAGGKKGWDLNRTQSPPQTQPPQNRRQQGGGGYQKKNNFANDPNAQNFQRAPVNIAPADPQQHAAQHVAAPPAAPAQQALAHLPAPAQPDGSQFVQNPGQPKNPKKRNRNKGGNTQQNLQNQLQTPQNPQNGQNFQPNQPQPPQPNQVQPKPNQPQNNQPKPQGQQNQGQPQNQQGQQGGKAGQKGRKNTAYVCHVVDPRTKLVLHVLELSQAQFDQHLLPLVQVQ